MTSRGALERPRLGLALGSGGARGWCHIGVIRELQAIGVTPDLVAGTSMGAVVGAAWASGRLDALEDWASGLTRARYLRLLDPKPFSGGLVEARGLEEMFAEIGVPERIEDFAHPFAAVATDMRTGRELWFREGPAHRAVRASAGIPGVMSPVWHQGTWLLDGGLVNPVPVSVARAMGADVIIAVDPNARSAGLVWEPQTERETPDLPDLIADLTRKLFAGEDGGAPTRHEAEPPRPPGYFDVVVTATSILGDYVRRSRLIGEPPDVLLGAQLRHINVLELDRSKEPIAEGRRLVRESAPFIRRAAGLET